jgi:hypothetical protein
MVDIYARQPAESIVGLWRICPPNLLSLRALSDTAWRVSWRVCDWFWLASRIGLKRLSRKPFRVLVAPMTLMEEIVTGKLELDPIWGGVNQRITNGARRLSSSPGRPVSVGLLHTGLSCAHSWPGHAPPGPGDPPFAGDSQRPVGRTQS